MTNEILVTKKVSLKKYLKQINISKDNNKLIEYCEKNYPDVKINYL